MPIPAGFNNTVRYVTNTPVAAADINAEIATQNGADYAVSSIEFINANEVVLLFLKMDSSIYGYSLSQKVNLVAANQAAIDADKAAEIVNGYWPTGMFITPAGALLILYQLLDEAPL
jgi:uncharacterized membrane protein YdbT with pleckstrin-like domain